MENMYNKLMNNLESLQLQQFRANLDTYIELIANGDKDIVSFI